MVVADPGVLWSAREGAELAEVKMFQGWVDVYIPALLVDTITFFVCVSYPHVPISTTKHLDAIMQIIT